MFARLSGGRLYRALTELRQDIRYGLRSLAAAPGFTAVALVSLTLGIGVATAAFSEVNGWILRDVPGVVRPEELVTVQGPVSYPEYRHYQEHAVFSSVAAYRAPVPFGVSIDGRTERVLGHLVTPSYFATLGVRPALGSAFERTPDQPSQPPTAVISDSFWRNKLGSDPAVIGKTLRINGHPCTIVGVGPKTFQGASPMIYGADIWIPIWAESRLAPELADNAIERRDLAVFRVVGRLLAGLTVERAEAELDAAARQLEQAYGEKSNNRKGRRVALLPGGKLVPMPKQSLPMYAGFFSILGGMILLIACANLANMSLARASTRRREIAVRLALGASRARLIRQLLTESMLVAVAAGAAGFGLAAWVMHGASQEVLRYPMPIRMNYDPDGRVVLFTLGLIFLTGLAFGLLPALRATRTDLTPALKEGGPAAFRRYRRLNSRNLLVISQVAGSMMLLTITGFLVLSHRHIADTGTGFDPDNLYLLSVDPVRDGFTGSESAVLMPKLLERIERLPFVSAAALADAVPMSMIGRPTTPFSATGSGTKTVRDGGRFAVSREYFETMGIPILRGRAFRREDQTGDGAAAIISERLAHDCFQGEDPVGRRIEIGIERPPEFQLAGAGGVRRSSMPEKPRGFEIVGVARNVRDGLNMKAQDAPPVIYLPLRSTDYSQSGLHGFILLVRASPRVDALGTVRREITAMDSRLTPFDARTMQVQIEELLFPVWVALYTYGVIGICGLILASVGLAGVTAYTVARRRREIGIRMAVGAQRSDVLALVMKEGLVLIGIGTVLGIAGARAGNRLLASVFSQIARTAGAGESYPILDWGCPLLLAALALAAAWVPARKSMRIDPAVTLRQE